MTVISKDAKSIFVLIKEYISGRMSNFEPNILVCQDP
jgi:hypothetical protein